VKVGATPLEGVLRIEPSVFRDERGFFVETYRAQRYREVGVAAEFVQDNLSRSQRGVLRGLHFQRAPHAQAKLVHVIRGEVFDVVVDVRVGSPSFGRWYGTRLSGEDGAQLYVPVGFAHGFCTLSDEALLAYKCSAYYAPDAEQTLLWSDPAVGVEWPCAEPRVSPKDARGLPLRAIEPSALPRYPSG
jgi:dTDP-4-dehydrorhamnose 3,5-epimerase